MIKLKVGLSLFLIVNLVILIKASKDGGNIIILGAGVGNNGVPLIVRSGKKSKKGGNIIIILGNQNGNDKFKQIQNQQYKQELQNEALRLQIQLQQMHFNRPHFSQRSSNSRETNDQIVQQTKRQQQHDDNYNDYNKQTKSIQLSYVPVADTTWQTDAQGGKQTWTIQQNYEIGNNDWQQ